MSAQPQSPSKTQNVQQQVNEVVGIMQNNIEKVMERGEKLDSLATKTEDLQQSSMQFKRGATKVRKAMWWKDIKLKLMIAVVVIIILCIIIIPMTTGGTKASSAALTSSPSQATASSTSTAKTREVAPPPGPSSTAGPNASRTSTFKRRR